MQNERSTKNIGADFIVEPAVEPEEEFVIQGRRIVDINFFIKKIQELNNHSVIGCTFSDIHLVSEDRRGFKSTLKFKCKVCNFDETVPTEANSEIKNVNTDAVNGIISIGCGNSNMEELFSILNIPSMCNKTFIIEHERVSAAWEKTALTEVKEAADEEKK